MQVEEWCLEYSQLLFYAGVAGVQVRKGLWP